MKPSDTTISTLIRLTRNFRAALRNVSAKDELADYPLEQVPVGETFFDYQNQAWVIGGVYQRCGHPETMGCDCFGRIHAGERASWQAIERNKTEQTVAAGLASVLRSDK